MNMHKRNFLGLAAGLALAGAASARNTASAKEIGADLGAAPPARKKEIPHRKVTTKNLSRRRPDFQRHRGRARRLVDRRTESAGLWQDRQAACAGSLLAGGLERQAVENRVDGIQQYSGMAYGNGHIWMGANGGPEGVYETDMNSKTVSHRQIPLGPADNGGGCHGLMFHEGKLWIVANRLKAILRVDPRTWAPEFIIPITTDRWHGIAWDETHPGGAIWMVTGSSDKDRYEMVDGKLHHTTTSGLVKYDATTGAPVETAEFLEGTADPHGLAFHNGKLISCDAGSAPRASTSPTARPAVTSSRSISSEARRYCIASRARIFATTWSS